MKEKKVLVCLILVLATFLLTGIKPVYAQNGPSNVWAVIELYNENNDRVYDNGDVNNSIIEGMTYDKATNTLTLNNFKTTAGLFIAQMGEDFKIKLVGENEVGSIKVNDPFDNADCNLNIKGYGSLTVNKERNSGYSAISTYNGKLIVDDSATLELYSYEDTQDASNNRPVISIYNNTENKNDIIVFKNGDTPATATNGDYTFVNLTSLTVLPIYHVEIEKADLSLKVGESPAFNARIKNNHHNLKLAQTIISTPNRWSTISSDANSNGDANTLVKNFKYDYIIEVTIENSKGNIYNENIDLYVDGVKWTAFNFVSEDTFYVYIKDEITPKGYIPPAYLDNSFENRQIKSLEEKILQDIKAGKVEYKNVLNFTAEETKEIVQNALNNGDTINASLYISETIHKSLTDYYFNEDETSGIEDKIGKNQKLGAYYSVEIEIFVNGDIVGYISSLENPIQVTVPLPNGLPKVANGYQRVWKIIRKHEGVIDILDAEETENGISFETDRFSSFAAIYEDVKTGEIETANNPKTGDNITLYISMLGLSIIGLTGIGFYSKKRKKLRSWL